MKHMAAALLCSLALGNALGEPRQPVEDFLQAPDRVEWPAGGLYDGRFEDGTHFQIELAYPVPGGLPDRVSPFAEAYWYPKHYQGDSFPLTEAGRAGNTLRLVLQPDPKAPAQESFTVALAADKLSGQGSWNSSTLHKQMAFTLRRAIVYDYVVVKRPAPPEASQDDPTRSFVFSASFPVLGELDADAWIREQAGACLGDLECANAVQVRWKSAALLSLSASAWGYSYSAAHGNGGSVTRQYRVGAGHLEPLEFGAFVDPGAACETRVKQAILAKLHAKGLAWADEWAERASFAPGRSPKFTPTASGIAFQFDPYEVGPYMQGAPSVFLTRQQLGSCARNLPSGG